MKKLQTSDFVRIMLAVAVVATVSFSNTGVGAQNPPPPPPPGVLPQGEPTNAQTVVVGSYRLVVPKDIVVTPLGNGRFQFQKGGMTAHIAAVPQTGTAVAADRLAAIRAAWNLEQPLVPKGQIVTVARPKAGGTRANQRYQQTSKEGAPLHGLFSVHIGAGPSPEAFVVDAFVPGPAASARDWKQLTQFVDAVLSSISLKRPW